MEKARLGKAEYEMERLKGFAGSFNWETEARPWTFGAKHIQTHLVIRAGTQRSDIRSIASSHTLAK